MANTAFKMGLAWHLGQRDYAIKVLKALGIVLVAGIIIFFFI